jgi:hypothetical protein
MESFGSLHALSKERSNAAYTSSSGGCPLCFSSSSLRNSWKESSFECSSSDGGSGGDGGGVDGRGGGGGDGGGGGAPFGKALEEWPSIA